MLIILPLNHKNRASAEADALTNHRVYLDRLIISQENEMKAILIGLALLILFEYWVERTK